MALIRYNSNGSLDSSFNGTGIIFESFEDGGDDGGYSINIQTDGKIIVCGSSYIGTNADNFALRRYNNDGSIDSTFGTNGTTITDFGSSYDLCFSSIIQNDGKIILGGYIIDETTFNFDFGLARYNSNGTLDTTFGINGVTKTDLNNNSRDMGISLAFHSNNTVLLAGNTRATDKDHDFAIARYVIDGVLDIDNFKNSLKNFIVYPNPTSGNITIHPQTVNSGIVNIEIYSANGKKVKSFIHFNLDNNQNIPVEDLIAGIYFMKILNDRNTEILKIMIK